MKEVELVLQSVSARPTVATYLQAARELRPLGKLLRPVRLSLLATFTIDSLVPYLEVEAAGKGFAADVYVGPFNTVRQELLGLSSGCLKHRPDVVFVTQLLSDVCPPLAYDYLVLGDSQIEQYVEEIILSFVTTLKEFRGLSKAAVVVHNFTLPSHPLLGIYEVMAPRSQTEVVRELNARLVDALRVVPDAYVLDFDRLCADVGYRNWYDHKMWHLGRVPLSAQVLPALARMQSTFVEAILGSPRKCLVLDLDNILWGGVIGEDGVAGIKLGHTYPGSAYRYFQQVVLQLHRRGVILAINSKNNRADVEEVFRLHPDMVVKLEHFASIHVNWREKSENMLEIADDLSIGVDDLVFFDDSPTERELMHHVLPQVMTLEVPGDPLKYPQVLLESQAFDKLSFTDEDRRRGDMYREQAVRHRMERSATSVEEFYGSLQITVGIYPVDEFAFPRVLDLIHKTNQFNLTTRRHSASQLAELIADPTYGVFSLRVIDRFGDNGIVGAAIVRIQESTAYIDTLLLSCRVIGHGVETALLYFLVDWSKTKALTVIEGEFIPTPKNAPATNFYADHGFSQVGRNSAGSRWRLQLDEIPFRWPSHISLAKR